MALSSKTELRLVNSQHRQEKEKNKNKNQQKKIKMKAKNLENGKKCIVSIVLNVIPDY